MDHSVENAENKNGGQMQLVSVQKKISQMYK